MWWTRLTVWPSTAEFQIGDQQSDSCTKCFVHGFQILGAHVSYDDSVCYLPVGRWIGTRTLFFALKPILFVGVYNQIEYGNTLGAEVGK